MPPEQGAEAGENASTGRAGAGTEGWSPLTENGITQRFLAHWAGKPPTRLQELACKLSLPFTFGNRFLTRPAFLEADQLRLAECDASALLDLLFTLPRRLFKGDLTAMGVAVGLAPAQVEAIVRTATEHPPRLARADFYYDGRAFQLLEYNVSSALGGWDIAILARWLLQDPGLASFIASEGLEFTDTLAAIADVIHGQCAGLDCPSRPVVALVDWPATYPAFGPCLDFMARSLEPFGFDAVGCHAGQLAMRGGHLFLERKHIDIVYRFIPLGELAAENQALEVVEPIIAAAERGTVRLVTGFEAGLYASKGCLALLHDDDHRRLFSPVERALIDRTVPWTKILRPGETFTGNQRIDLVDYVLANRAELILKPTQLYGGAGITPGWKTDQRTWTEAVHAALSGRFVVQRRVRPATERFPADGAMASHDELALNWGVILAGTKYAGTMTRALPGPDPGVINTTLGAGVTCTFHAADRK